MWKTNEKHLKSVEKNFIPPSGVFFHAFQLVFGTHTWKTQACTFSEIGGFGWMDLWLAASTFWLQVSD